MARLSNYRQPARHTHGAERIGGIFTAGATASGTGSALIYNRNLRTVRICQPELHWNPDRRHWRAGAEQERRTRPARHSRHAGRHNGEPDVSVDRGDAAVTTFDAARARFI